MVGAVQIAPMVLLHVRHPVGAVAVLRHAACLAAHAHIAALRPPELPVGLPDEGPHIVAARQETVVVRRHARARRPVPGRPDGDRIRRREPAAPHLGHGRAHGHHAVGRQGVEQGVEDPAAGRVIGLRHGFEPEMVRVIPLAPHADEPRLQDTNHRPVPLQQRPELGDMPQHDRLGRIPGLLPLGIAVRETHDRLAAALAQGFEIPFHQLQTLLRQRAVDEVAEKILQQDQRAVQAPLSPQGLRRERFRRSAPGEPEIIGVVESPFRIGKRLVRRHVRHPAQSVAAGGRAAVRTGRRAEREQRGRPEKNRYRHRSR